MKISEPYTIYPRTLNSGKTVYYYQYRLPDGSRSSAKSTGCTTLASAKRYCNKLYNSGEFKASSKLRFAVYSENFFNKESNYYKWKKVNKSAPTDNTLLRYNGLLKYQLLPYFENYTLSAITRQEIKKWIVWASESWSEKTVNNAQTVLNLILNQAVDEELINYNPAVNIGFRKTKKLNRELLTIEEISKIYYSPLWSWEFLRNAFLLDAITGMRISELISLRKQDIHDDYILVAHTYHQKFGLGETTKGKVARIVPIPADIKLPIVEKDTDYLYLDNHNKPFHLSRMRDNIVKIAESLGIDYKKRKISTHSLRAFYTSYLEKNNIPDRKVKAVIGHKIDDVTDIYTYWQPDSFPEIHEVQNLLYKQILNAKE